MIIFPVTLVVSFLRYTPLFDAAVSSLTPVMGLFGLPGEAALPLVLGNFLNLYAAIGAMLAMDLTVKQVFILALMLSFSHGLPVESAVCKRIGAGFWIVTGFRVALALAAGLLVNLLWRGGSEPASYGLVAPAQAEPEGFFEVAAAAFGAAFFGVVQISLIVLAVMFVIQILKDLGALGLFARMTKPLLKPLGISSRGSVTMAGGLVFGLAFGAGIILEQAREHDFSRREITLIALFLCACHAVIEDTLIFIPLGINVLPLLVIRLVTAVVLVALIAALWKETSATSKTPVVNKD
ncbi:Nucleoside recognition [Rubrobacter radiotolerans]|uniref:Nucleoside recognition n=1 Tax=Rubrobacter radiotolerans TaxID=42256 RepID=A0A023X038_RUBRA|nr:nucleoside recognition domain-containing protein [Rubrobacter radiotolerans]AHY45385.1 Nucleoside recognition [Rubrobacter radiotolerans]MDX5892796.1 nucleoside recognition domain-containing protein [Rubrobacter radiotolerans]